MSSPKPHLKSSSPQTQVTPREKTRLIMAFLVEPIDVIGKTVMGDLWKTFYDSIRDAIALSLLLKIPGLIGLLIIGKDFSGFDTCMLEGALGVNRYACFIIISSDFCLWIVLGGRVISRFINDFNYLFTKKRG